MYMFAITDNIIHPKELIRTVGNVLSRSKQWCRKRRWEAMWVLEMMYVSWMKMEIHVQICFSKYAHLTCFFLLMLFLHMICYNLLAFFSQKNTFHIASLKEAMRKCIFPLRSMMKARILYCECVCMEQY